METIPDAPWVRETELYGMPEPPPVYCPVCGEECETFYLEVCNGIKGNIIGCENCIEAETAENEEETHEN